MTGTFLTRLRRFGCEHRGSASIEFAFIAPILMLMYFAVAELSLALEANRKVTSTASVIGDLVAQTEEVNQAEVDAIFQAADAVMQPLDEGPMEIRVTSASMELDGDIHVNWSRSRNTAAISCGATLTPPEAVLNPGQSIIIAEVAYDYIPPIGQVLTGVVRMEDAFYLRPRESAKVEMLPSECP